MSTDLAPLEVTTLKRGGYRGQSRPVVVRGGARHWPALTRWTPELFQRVGSGYPVRVTYGNAEQRSTRLQTIHLDAYVERCFSRSPADPTQHGLHETPYVHELRLTGPLRALRGDILLSDVLGAVDLVLEQAIWIGPSNTVTGLHYDHPDNFVCQIAGVKRFTFFPPEQSQYLYPGRKYDMGSTSAQVDALRPDAVRYPNFANARGHTVVMRPGDLMYTPSGWWHQVESLEPSITVASFFARPAQALRVLGLVTGRLAHSLRLYRWGDCTCHAPRRPKERSE